MPEDFTTKERILVHGGLIDEVRLESTQNPEELQEIIYKIYEITRQHHPDREPDIPALLRNYRGREQQLLSKLIKNPDLLLKLKKSYEPRKNLAPIASDVIEKVASRLEKESKINQEGGTDEANASGTDLFASFRDSLMFDSESAPVDQEEGKEGDQSPGGGDGLSNLVMGAFGGSSSVDQDANSTNTTSTTLNKKSENSASQQKIVARRRVSTVQQVAAGEAPLLDPSGGDVEGGGGGQRGSIMSSVIGLLDHETPFQSLNDAQRKERLDAREVSSYVEDPLLDTSSDFSWTKVKDKVECFRELDTLVERAKLLETLNLDDAVLVLVELKLRGDYGDVLGAIKGKGALGAIKNKAKAASINKPIPYGGPPNGKKLKGSDLLPPETTQLIACTNDNQLAKLFQGLPLLRSATMLLEMRRRGSSGTVLDCLTPGGLAAILVHLPPPERAALLVSMTPAKCSEALAAMSTDDQAMALYEMSDDEVLVAVSSLNKEQAQATAHALVKYKEKEKKKMAKKNKKGNNFGFNIFSKSKSSKNETDIATSPINADGAELMKSLGGNVIARPQRRSSDVATINRFAANAGRRADKNKIEQRNRMQAKEAREIATRARAASVAANEALENVAAHSPPKAEKSHHQALAKLLEEANNAEEAARLAEKQAAELEELEAQEDAEGAQGGDSDSSSDDDDDEGGEKEEEGGDITGGFFTSATSLFGGAAFFAEATQEFEKATAAASEAASGATAAATEVAQTTGNVVGEATEAASQAANKASEEASNVAKQVGQGANDIAPDLQELGDVALPSWARAGEGDEEEVKDGEDREDGSMDRTSVVSDVVSEATTDLDGISERGAGDAEILDSMVWSYLMSGLPADEQAKYEAMNDDQRRAAMGLAATRATKHRQQMGLEPNTTSGGGVGGVDFSNMTSGEAAVAAKRLREAAENAKKQQEAEATSSWTSLFSSSSPGVFDAGAPLPPPESAHPINDSSNSPFMSPKGVRASFTNWLPDPMDLAAIGAGSSEAENTDTGPHGNKDSFNVLASLRKSFAVQPGALTDGTAKSSFPVIIGSEAQQRATLMQLEESCVRSIANKRNMNRAVREQDESYLEEETAPTPLVAPQQLLGYVDTSSRAQMLYSSQDAKILSSKWGISISEIKILASHVALVTGDNGMIDPRFVPFVLNRLGYYETIDMGLIPPQAKSEELKGKDQFTWRLPKRQSLKALNPVEFADVFGKCALALAESDKPSPPTAGELEFRVSLTTDGINKDKVLMKDACAALASTSDARMERYLYIFNEMCKSSKPPMSVTNPGGFDGSSEGGFNGTPLDVMESRLMGRALRRVGFGKPNAIQAKMISKIVGLRLPMPEAIAVQLGWIESNKHVAHEDDLGVISDDEMDPHGNGYEKNPTHTGFFEFLATVSVMARYEDLNIDTSSLPNGDDSDEGVNHGTPKQRTMYAATLTGSRLTDLVNKTKAKSDELIQAIAKRVEEEGKMAKKFEEVDHGFGGGQLFLLSNLFDAFAQDFNLHRKTVRVVNDGLRALLRAMGILPLDSQLKAIRATYGDLALNVHIDQFFLLCSNLHHWFPAATPRRFLVVAGKVSVNQGLGLSQTHHHHHHHHKNKDGVEDESDAVNLEVVSEIKTKPASRSTLTARASFIKNQASYEEKAKQKAKHHDEDVKPQGIQKSHFVISDVSKLEHAFSVYDYDKDGVVGQVALRALLRRLHVNWSAKQFVRVTTGALGATLPDYDVDDFVTLLASTSAVMVHSKLEKKEGQPGRRVSNHHAKILYSHFSVIWNLPTPQLLLIQRLFLEEELNAAVQIDVRNKMHASNPSSRRPSASRSRPEIHERATVPRSSIRSILNKLGINYARVEASGMSESFDINGQGSDGANVDFDELLGIVAHVVHLYGYVGDGRNDDPLTNLSDDAVRDAHTAFFGLAIDPNTGKAPAKHCLVALRQLKLVKTDMELDKCLRLSGTMPQYRSGWLSWPSFIRLLAQLNHQKLKDERLLKSKQVEVFANLKPSSSKPPAEVSDINKLRAELSKFVHEQTEFENYMERLNHTYKILQNESSTLVPARPPEPEEAPISKKDQHKATSALFFKSKTGTGSFHAKSGSSAGKSGSFTGKSGSFTGKSGSFSRKSGSFNRSNSFGLSRKESKGSFESDASDWAMDGGGFLASKPSSNTLKSPNSDLDFKDSSSMNKPKKPGVGGLFRDDSINSVNSEDVFQWDD
jgi:Ca2+-binding EF-hand superfamily protein